MYNLASTQKVGMFCLKDFQLDPTDYDRNTERSITHVCELILT